MNQFMPSIIIVAVVLLAANTLVTAASQVERPNYHVSMVVPLGPPDRWDYVVFDPDTRRVYVAHGDRITVVDGTNGNVVGTVEGMPAVRMESLYRTLPAGVTRMTAKPALLLSST